ncbi:MAG: ABC transporter permease [Chloroflexi bacterium]|nr:ABC transporter permease [Chloroflexota bacterium]
MRDYLIRRILLGVLTTFVVAALVFLIMRVVPGDITHIILGEQSGAGQAGVGMVAFEQRIQRLKAELGLSQPIYMQFGKWVWSMVRLDPGTSFTTMRPVLHLVRDAAPVTIELALMGFVLTVVLALVAGVLSALRQDTWVDYFFRIFTIGGLALPSFWVGVMVILGLALLVGYMPPPGYRPINEDPWASMQQFLVPGLVLGWRSAAVTGRMIRSSMLEVLREDYVRTAWAKGLTQRTIVVRHVLKNAALPVVTLLGFQLNALLGGVAVIEIVFGLPGLGRVLVEAIRGRDYPTIQFLIMLFAVVTIVMNLVVDILYGWLDPRIKYA